MAVNQDTIHVNGQVWIDKNPPHSMMYHVEGVDYEIQNQARYRVANGNALTVGSIVALDIGSDPADITGGMGTPLTTVQRLRKAEFPTDSSNILGVVTYIGEERDSYYDVAVSSDGFLEVSVDAFPQDCETLQEDGKNISIIRPKTTEGVTYDFREILGAPVYWFIGRNAEGNSGYIKNVAGAMTLYLPSGECTPLGKPSSDIKYDVAYQDLPLIGEIVAYSLDDQNRGYTNFRIHLNIQNTYSPISWYWPKSNTCSRESLDMGITIHHGLPLEEGNFLMETQVIAVDTNGQMRSVHLDCTTGIDTGTQRGYTSAKSKNASKSGYPQFKVQGKVYYKEV